MLPLIPATAHWWESNLHRFYVAGGLAAITLAYYLTLHAHPLQTHWPAPHVALPSPSGLNLTQTGEVLANAILSEYVPFIILLFSLYTISGGIRIEGDLPAHPVTNAAFLAVGGLLASFIGTTGAAMLLIRPLLETNRERKHVKHTVIFFTFIVCNCGGCLLPLGDPPLFLGYLMGVPFLWTLVLWKEWLFVNAALLIIYLLWDRYWCYPREKAADIARDETRRHRLRFSGVWPNALLLLGVILSVGLLDPGKAVPGTDWHPWMYLREMVQLALVGLSLAVGAGHARRANRFNYAAIIEVAVLFFGIFICMQPALQILGVEGPKPGVDRAVAVLLGQRRPLVGARQRPDLRRLLRDGEIAVRRPRPRRFAGRRRRTPARRPQPGVRIHGRQHVHRQRAELHGEIDRREIGSCDAQLFRIYVV